MEKHPADKTTSFIESIIGKSYSTVGKDVK